MIIGGQQHLQQKQEQQQQQQQQQVIFGLFIRPLLYKLENIDKISLETWMKLTNKQLEEKLNEHPKPNLVSLLADHRTRRSSFIHLQQVVVVVVAGQL